MTSEVRTKIEDTIRDFLTEHTDAGAFSQGLIDDLCTEISQRLELALVPYLRTNKFDFGDSDTKISYDDPLDSPVRRASDSGPGPGSESDD